MLQVGFGRKVSWREGLYVWQLQSGYLKLYLVIDLPVLICGNKEGAKVPLFKAGDVSLAAVLSSDQRA